MSPAAEQAPPIAPATAIVLLAGGRATRLGGGDKCRLVVAGRTIIHRALAALRPQAHDLALSANGDPGRFADLGLPVLPDPVPGQPGPLAGILAGLDWAAAQGWPRLVTVPGDCPFLPPDLVERLGHASAAAYACAASAGRIHPATAIWSVRVREDLRAALLAGQRKVGAFTARYAGPAVHWPAEPADPFFNVNTPADLAEAGRLAAMPDPSAPPPAAPPCTSPAAATRPPRPG